MLLPYSQLQRNVLAVYHLNTERTTLPLYTTIPFDYCFRDGEQENLLKSFQHPEVVGVLSDKEYIELIYAFYKSPLTPQKYIPIFEKILEEFYSKPSV